MMRPGIAKVFGAANTSLSQLSSSCLPIQRFPQYTQSRRGSLPQALSSWQTRPFSISSRVYDMFLKPADRFETPQPAPNRSKKSILLSSRNQNQSSLTRQPSQILSRRCSTCQVSSR